MLVQLVDRWPSDIGAPDAPDLVLGDGVRPPFGERSFDLVAALGNLLGFAGAESDRLLESLTALLAGGGTLLLEIAPGPGERSRYLRRLPPRSVARLMRAPPRAVATRVEREGFIEETRRKAEPGDFRRVGVEALQERLVGKGFHVEEVIAVAPALGPDATRAAEVARDPKAWTHLLEVEELLGRSPDRWASSAAVLVAAIGPALPESPSPPRPPPKRRIK